jgi:RHS repeat-associated protein
MKSITRLISIMALVMFILAGTTLAGKEVFFYHTDPAGTPLAITDSTGNVVWRADYKPFGEAQSITGTLKNNKQFIGKEKDKETGLHYFDARYYLDKTGRFTSPDPLGPVDPWTGKVNEKMLMNPQRLNRYAYGLNNPYRYIDPDGRDVWDIGFFTYSSYKFAKEPSWENAGYLGLDAVGLVPIVPALGTIARVGKGAERAMEASSIGAKIARGHAFEKHANEFKDLGIHTRKEFSDFVKRIMQNAKGADIKQLSKGRTAYWDDASSTVVIHNPAAKDAGTAFRPTTGKKYFTDDLK